MSADASEQLAAAIDKNNVEKVKALLKTDSGLIKKSFGEGFDNRTPLCRAAEHGFRDIVEVLIEWNADVNEKDSFGSTCLWWAAERGHVDLVTFLKSHGATPAVSQPADEDDGTCYDYAGLNFSSDDDDES